MKIDLDQPILDQNDKPMQRPEAGEATLGFTAATALFAPIPGDEKLDGLKKAQMGELGLRLSKGGVQDLTPEELVMIRDRVGKACLPLVVARVFAMTDQPA